jgi:hypothetical protein
LSKQAWREEESADGKMTTYSREIEERSRHRLPTLLSRCRPSPRLYSTLILSLPAPWRPSLFFLFFVAFATFPQKILR